MPNVRMPGNIWGWRCTTAVALLAALALATATQIGPAPPSWTATAGMAGLVGYPLVLASAAFAYVHWRLTDSEISAWLCMGLAAVGVNGLAVAGAVTARPELLTEATTWLVLVELTVTLGLFVLVSMSAAGEPVLDPMALGLVIGVSLGAGLRDSDHPARRGRPARRRAGRCSAWDASPSTSRWLATCSTRRRCRPGARRASPWASRSSASATSPSPSSPERPEASIVRLGGTLGGAVLLFCTAMALLRSGIEEATQALGAAGGRAALAEAQQRHRAGPHARDRLDLRGDRVGQPTDQRARR